MGINIWMRPENYLISLCTSSRPETVQRIEKWKGHIRGLNFRFSACLHHQSEINRSKRKKTVNKFWYMASLLLFVSFATIRISFLIILTFHKKFYILTLTKMYQKYNAYWMIVKKLRKIMVVIFFSNFERQNGLIWANDSKQNRWN